MNAQQLIEALKQLPQEVEVGCVWDGGIRTDVRHVWLTRDGKHIALADYDALVLSDWERPVDAPDENSEEYWHAPSAPE